MSVAEKEVISLQKREDVNGVNGSRAGTAPLLQTASNSVLGKKVAEDGRVFTAAEVGAHKTETDAWICVDGSVYDITRFIETHPGGKETILEHLGNKDVGKVMRGEYTGSASHSHSKYAFRMLQQFVIGRVSEYQSEGDEVQEATGGSINPQKRVDLSKPLVFQVGQLGANYDKWVHDPIVQKEPPRFFKSDIAEFFTQTAWWVIPLVWFPLVAYASMQAHKHGLWTSAAPFTMACGAFIWTFIEYCLHRCLFHMKTSGYWMNTLHYFLHGFHHKHPMDGTRLVFPPAVTALIVALIWFVTEPLVAIIGRPVKLSMFSGGVLMYIAYDLTHYFLHFGTAFSETSRMMKRFHLNHHFKDQSNSYGITTTFWDWVFETLPPHLQPWSTSKEVITNKASVEELNLIANNVKNLRT